MFKNLTGGLKNLTGGLKSHTTKIGALAALAVAGDAAHTVLSGGAIDWKNVLLGGAIAIIGALSKAQNEEPAK